MQCHPFLALFGRGQRTMQLVMTRIFVKIIQILAPSQLNVSMNQIILWDRSRKKITHCGKNALSAVDLPTTLNGRIVKITFSAFIIYHLEKTVRRTRLRVNLLKLPLKRNHSLVNARFFHGLKDLWAVHLSTTLHSSF